MDSSSDIRHSSLQKVFCRSTEWTLKRHCLLWFVYINSDYSEYSGIDGLVLRQMDVKTAFLNGLLDEKICIK